MAVVRALLRLPSSGNTNLVLIGAHCHLQVKIRMRNQTVQKTIPSSAEFVKFLKTEESLNSCHMLECELYCLANILGVPIYQLTYNLVGVGGKPEERCR